MRNEYTLEAYKSRFMDARAKVLGEEGSPLGIGTLGEKCIHKVLKFTVEPDVKNHEKSFLGSVADVLNSDGVFEIQTRAFKKLLPKLKKMLPTSPVTVIYPIIRRKSLAWLDPESGELSAKHPTPRRGRPSDILYELSGISELIGTAGLTVRIVLLDADEYRLLDGYGKDRKKRATKLNKIPIALCDVIDVLCASDIIELLPTGLPETFTAAELYRALAFGTRRGYYSLKLLLDLKIVERVGKDGRAYLYKFAYNANNCSQNCE